MGNLFSLQPLQKEHCHEEKQENNQITPKYSPSMSKNGRGRSPGRALGTDTGNCFGANMDAEG